MSGSTKLLVYYGGETGNSEDLAKRITWRAQSRNVHVTAEPIDVDTFDKLSKLTSSKSDGDLKREADLKVLFICSTTGQGDVPRTMIPFWKQLMRKTLSSDHFNNLRGYIIGLGDSSYMKYNFVAKKLSKRLKLLGFNQLIETVFGDDQHDHGLDAGVEPFLQQLWDSFNCDGISYGDKNDLDDRLIPPTIRFEKQMIKNCWTPIQMVDKSSFITSAILSNQRVTAKDHFQDTRLIKIALVDGLDFNTGDVVAIEPINDGDEVTEFIDLLNLDANEVIYPNLTNKYTVTANSKYKYLPNKITISDLVSKFVDIHSIPKRSFFDLIWRFSDDEIERTKFREFSTSEGLDDYLNYVTRPRRTVLEVLRDFRNTAQKIPLKYICDLIPAIKEREFSIANCSNNAEHCIDVLIAIVEYKTRLRTPRTGLCSNYMSKLSSGNEISVKIKKGSLILPSTDLPVILIGPGTGVAPLRAIIQERVSLRIFTNYLFFGCRNEDKDFYFKEEFDTYVKNGQLNLFTAFSRKDKDAKSKTYVQHVLMKQKELINRLISEENASIIICGSSKQMPDNVRDAIIDILVSGRQDGDDKNEETLREECEKIVSIMESRKRIQYECWS